MIFWFVFYLEKMNTLNRPSIIGVKFETSKSMKNKISPYWLCQLSGWSLACLYWIITMVQCQCITFRNGSINTILTFTTGILVTHFYVLIIRKYKLQEKDFPQVIYYIILFIVVISVSLWFVNVFINYYTYKLYENEFDSLSAYAKSSFDMFIAFMRIAANWVLAYFLFHLGKRSNIAEKEKIELNQLFAESSLNHLKEQVNPHFMFNSLNSVKALISEDPEKARTAIAVLADILRNSLNSSSKPTIPLQEELEHCRDYLEMEKIRFEEKLQYEINIQETITGFNLPPLSIQTLVENAIKHGLSESLTGGKISIDCWEENDSIITTVINDGKLKSNNSNGIGIKNLKKRFEILYPKNYNFTIFEKDGKVIAQFKLPKEKIL